MKICHVTDYLPNYHKIWGGAEQACYRIIQLLLNNNIDVCVIGTKPIKNVIERFQFYEIPIWEKFFHKRIIWRYSKIKYLCFPFDFLSFVNSFLLLKRIKPDILHLHRVNSISLSMVLSAKLLRIPVVISIYDYWSICPNSLLINPRHEICRKYHGFHCLLCKPIKEIKQIDNQLVVLRKIGFDFFLKKVNTFHVLSNSSKNILENYGIDKSKIKVIPLPAPIQSDEEIKQNNITNGLILFVGWVQPRKGVDIVVKATLKVVSNLPWAKLVVLGEIADQEYFKRIESFIKTNNIEKHVEFKKKVPFDEVKDYIKKAEVVVIAEQWENMSPVILYEAMFFAKPVVAGNIGGIAEFIEDSKDGFLVQYNNPDEFAERIIYVLKNKEIAKKIGKKAREKILAMTDENNLLKKFLDLYYEMV